MKLLDIFKKEEKKVEYLELIYDLIFVYIIGRNNSLLHDIEGGFFSASLFFAYILCSLAVIQIWNFSTFYTNMFGRNSIKDHIFMFVNMYLLYFVGESTRVNWETSQNYYNFAWALILINIGIQYVIQMRRHRQNPEARRTLRGLMIALFGEALIVLVSIPVQVANKAPFALAAILFGIIATYVAGRRSKFLSVDFAHLAERAMLFVVFTFGEMIIIIAGYFEGGFTPSNIYFSAICFLIAVGLFVSYEIFYDRILDTEQEITGLGYILIHIFLIFGINIITTSLEFMRNPEIYLIPKTICLILSFVIFFVCMFLLMRYARAEMKKCGRLIGPAVAASAVFAVLMILLKDMMRLNIIITVVYVAAILFMIYHFSTHPCAEKEECGCEEK